jgi:hypothetical protein
VGTEVQIKRTRYTRRELLAAMNRAWHVVVGGPAPRAALALLCGQVTLETGWDGESCWWHNVSNIMGESPEGLYLVLGKAPECALDLSKIPGATPLATTNVVCAPGQSAYLPAGGSKFRAYSNLDRACVDKLQVLKAIWPKSMEALAAATSPSDAVVFVSGLVVGADGKRRLYMTADPYHYAVSIKSIASTLIRTTVLTDWPDPWNIEGDPDTIPDGPKAKSEPRFQALSNVPIIDPGTGSDDWRPQTDAKDFLDTLVEKDDKS